MIKWLDYIVNSTFFILIINVLFYSVKFKDYSYLKWFNYYLGIAALIQFIGIILAKILIPNLPLLHIYTLLEFILLSLFYKKILGNENWFQQYIPYIISIGSILIIGNSIFIQSIFTFNSYAKAMSQIFIMGYVISYYFSILHKNNSTTPLLNLLNAAILLYYAGSFFIFMFSNVLLKNLDTAIQLLFWIFNALLYLIFQLLVLFAGWRKIYKPTKS